MQKGALPAIALALALCACGGSAPGPTDTDATTETPPDPSTPSPPADIVHDTDGQPVPLLGFDIAAVPPSQATLGELPFFSLPEGYAAQNRPHVRRHARFPFRLGDGVHWVE